MGANYYFDKDISELDLAECAFLAGINHSPNSYNPFDVCGYGATKEEALEDFKRKFKYVIDELKAFETILLHPNIFEIEVVDVDCFGKEIK